MTDRDQYASDLASDLHALENHIDRAIAAAAGLVARATLGRIEQGISAVVGQEALGRILASSQTLGAARHEVVQAHKAMALDARKLRMTWVSRDGPTTKPDEDGPRPTGVMPRLVA